MLHIAICDDMPEESALLKSMLEEYGEIHKFSLSIHIYSTGFLFIEEVSRNKQFGLCFLDIFMPSFSGLDTAKELRTLDKDMALIFCTSSTEYALDGYGVQASNYLVKPVKKDQVFTAMDDILRKIQVEKDKVLWFQTSNGLQKLTHSQILFGEPEGKFSRLILRDGTSVSCRLSFSELSENLKNFINFFPISRSVLLNFESVQGMEKDDFLLCNGQKIPIPRRKKKEITQFFLDYTMGLN